MAKDDHRGYDTEKEDEAYRKEKIMRPYAGGRKAQAVIDEWSFHNRPSVESNREEFENWYNGLMKLYGAKG